MAVVVVAALEIVEVLNGFLGEGFFEKCPEFTERGEFGDGCVIISGGGGVGVQ